MNEQKKTGKMPANDEDNVFEGGTGGDLKTTADDLKKAAENPAAYEGLRSMIINPDDDEEDNDRKKDNAGKTGDN